MTEGLLYTFRRCTYAMRARIALAAAEFEPEVREIVLARKPEHFLALSPKGTVPVMRTRAGRVLEESLDIVYMALETHDPRGWMATARQYGSVADELIANNDGPFKRHLDRYNTQRDTTMRTAIRPRACACLQPLRIVSRAMVCLQMPRVLGRDDLAVCASFANVEPISLRPDFWSGRGGAVASRSAGHCAKKVPEWQPDAEPVGFGATYGLTSTNLVTLLPGYRRQYTHAVSVMRVIKFECQCMQRSVPRENTGSAGPERSSSVLP